MRVSLRLQYWIGVNHAHGRLLHRLHILNPRGRQDLLRGGDVLRGCARGLRHCGLNLGRELRAFGEAVERSALEDGRQLRNSGSSGPFETR